MPLFTLRSEEILKLGLKRLVNLTKKKLMPNGQEKQKQDQESMTQEKHLMDLSNGLEKWSRNTNKDDIR